MATDVYPDDDNIFERIAEIQGIIVSSSVQPKTPIMSVDNLPYWLMVIRNLNSVPIVHRDDVWTFEVAMTLYRETAKVAQSNYGVISQINSDMINTMKEFELRRNLWTPTYPTTPLQLVPNSLRIQSEGYTEDPVGNQGAALAGSFYVLTFEYEILQSIDAIEATKTA